MSKNNIDADIFLSYEMVEHLLDPINFLRSISINTDCNYFIISVPYIRQSQVGLDYINDTGTRFNEEVFSEETHIFELCPEDWDLIFQFSGWKVIYSDRYSQYPSRGLYNIMKYEWRRFDYDGFYGVILKKDHSIMNRYKDW